MLTFQELLVFALLIGLLVGFWASSLRAREQALISCRRICREFNTQLLDQTVSMTRLRPARDARGRLVLSRQYAFEFSPDGQTRYTGRLYMLGMHAQSAQLDLPDGTTLVSPAGRRLDS